MSGRAGPGHLDIFVVDPEGAMQHVEWNGAVWRPLHPNFETISEGIVFHSEPESASWGANRIDVFCLDSNNHLRTKFQEGGNWQPGQLGWFDLGGGPAGRFRF